MMSPLPRATVHLPAAAVPAEPPCATLTLPFDERHRRRLRMMDDDGHAFMLDLPAAVMLADGDGLALDAGGWILVRAAEEEVAELTAPTPEALARLAWHIGNRHMPVQILAGGGLRLPWDHVLADMLKGLGAVVSRRWAAFQPEGGAYAQGHSHAAEPAHDHHHGHHHHDHDHEHQHHADHAPGQGGCCGGGHHHGHDHDHDHNHHQHGAGCCGQHHPSQG